LAFVRLVYILLGPLGVLVSESASFLVIWIVPSQGLSLLKDLLIREIWEK